MTILNRKILNILLYSRNLDDYIVQVLNNNKTKMPNKINPDLFNVLRVVKKFPNSSQRNLAKHLGFSLGKLNYCIKGLKLRGLLKLKYFNKHPKKISMLYVLTPKGVAAKTKITIKFMKTKMKEYEELKNEIE